MKYFEVFICMVSERIMGRGVEEGGGRVGRRGKAANVTGISSHPYLFWRPRESLEGLNQCGKSEAIR